MPTSVRVIMPQTLCERAVVSDDGKLVVVDGYTHVKPLFWAPLLPTAHIRIVSFVHLAKTAGASRDRTPSAYATADFSCVV